MKSIGQNLITMLSCAVMAVVGVISVAAIAGDDHHEDTASIKALRQQSNLALAAKDVARFTGFFDTDYIATYGSSAKVLSREVAVVSIRRMFEDSSSVAYVRTPISIHVSEGGKLAFEQGTWIGGPSSDLVWSGQYSAGWRRVGDSWKIHVELFVSIKCEGIKCAAGTL